MPERLSPLLLLALVGIAACDVTPPDVELDPSAIIVASVSFAGSDTVRLFLGRTAGSSGAVAGLADRIVEVGTPRGTVVLEAGGECGNPGFPGVCFTSELAAPLMEGDVLELFIEHVPIAITGRTVVPERPATEDGEDPIVVSEKHLDDRLITFELPAIVERAGRVELKSRGLTIFRPDSEPTECTARTNPPEGFDLAEGEIVEVRVFPRDCGSLTDADSIIGRFDLVRYDPELSRLREAFEGADEVSAEDSSAGVENAFGFFGAAATTGIELRVR